LKHVNMDTLKMVQQQTVLKYLLIVPMPVILKIQLILECHNAQLVKRELI